jgi:hypothetical protein
VQKVRNQIESLINESENISKTKNICNHQNNNYNHCGTYDDPYGTATSRGCFDLISQAYYFRVG